MSLQEGDFMNHALSEKTDLKTRWASSLCHIFYSLPNTPVTYCSSHWGIELDYCERKDEVGKQKIALSFGPSSINVSCLVSVKLGRL